MTPSRTIIALQPVFPGDGACVSIRRTPATIPGAEMLGPFDCPLAQMPAWTTPDAVRAHGATIWSRLAAHPPVLGALEYALATAQEVRPIYFLVNATEAERLSWESLYDGRDNFLALDRRWPIGRIAEPIVDQTGPPLEFAPPLRLMAVLSALQVDATRQWQKLRAAALNARANGLDIAIKVVVGQEELQDAIQAEIAAGTLAGTTVHPIPLDLYAFDDLLSGFEPHILHFFCHGVVGFGSAELQLGTVNDWAQEAAVGSLKLPVADLRPMAALRRVWLVVLNCCSSGESVGELHSMAHDFVANGVPAAIGMSEPIGAADADTFTEGFYDALIPQLCEALGSENGDRHVEIEWSLTMHRPRRQLVAAHNNDPGNARQWLLPTLYTRLEPFRVLLRRPASTLLQEPTVDPNAAAQRWERAKAVAGMLRALASDTPMATRLEIRDLLADLPAALQPDAYGRFPTGAAQTPSPVTTPGLANA